MIRSIKEKGDKEQTIHSFTTFSLCLRAGRFSVIYLSCLWFSEDRNDLDHQAGKDQYRSYSNTGSTINTS